MNSFVKTISCFVFFIFLEILNYNPLFAVELKLQKTFETSANLIFHDLLGNYYLLYPTSIQKYNGDGNLLSTYSANKYGQISAIDVSNPLKILVFFKSFSQIIFIDNTLSEISTSSITNTNVLPNVSVACSSKKGGIWYFDQSNSMLCFIDENSNLLYQSTNLTQQLGTVVNPSSIKEINNLIYLNDSLKGILAFDQYANYVKKLPFTNVSSFQIIDNRLFYLQKNKFYYYQMDSFDSGEIILPVQSAIDFCINDNKLIILDGKSAKVFSISQ